MTLRTVITAATLVWAGCLAQAGALEWQAGPGYRTARLAVSTQGKTGFTLLSPDATGILFANQLADTAIAQNRILENGSGVALGDVDGDGWCDVYVCGLERPNVLYRNLGNWKFEEITTRAGVACPNQFSTGALFADVEGDGDLDLFVNSLGGGTRLFLNRGDAIFSESRESGLAPRFCATSMAMADIDGDGDLELYVANYRTTTVKDGVPGLKVESLMVDGKVVITPEDRFEPVITRNGGIRVRELGEPDILYVNKGQGRFGPISWTGGAFADEEGKPLAGPPRDWGLSAMFRDVNGDNAPDIYVCNDFFYSFDRLWINEHGRRFRTAPRLAWRRMSMSSMAVDFADVNRDGFDDFFVADMLSRDHGARHRQRANITMMRDVDLPIADAEFRPEAIQNTLHLNRGDGTYAEVAHFAGVEASEWTWSAAFMDVDLDGYEDLLITNGNEHDVLDADTLKETATPNKSAEQHLKDLRKFARIDSPNLAFRNRGDLTFVESGAEWGFATRGVSHGMALGDLDNDGDLDVVINNLNAPVGVYRNESAAPRLAVRLKGNAPNTRGVGARIKIIGGPFPQSQEMICGGRYLSGDDSVRVFAAFSETNELKIEITWRNGSQSIVERALANRVIEVDEAGARIALANADTVGATNRSPWFTDASTLIDHRHQENPFDDFQRQPLLPGSLSRLGPGIAWCDLNGDGWDDLLIGSGKGAPLAIYHSDAKGGFKRVSETPFNQLAPQDQTGLAVWKRQDDALLFVGLANYEERPSAEGWVRRYSIGRKEVEDIAIGRASSTGPLALADIDGDGDLDLFVGGQAVGSRWPEPADSRLYRGEGAQLKLDQASTAALQKVGLVSGAVWSDLDADGLPELILACQWGPIRVFAFKSGALREMTATLGLEKFTGWWTGVTSGDIDGDGKLDIIASNWGMNSPYRATSAKPARLYYGDFLGRGAVDIVETEYDSFSGAVVPLRPLDVFASAIPPMRDRFSTHRAFGKAGVADVLGPYKSVAKELQATTLSSMIFFNRPGQFTAVELPTDAQLAPAFSVNVGDFDCNGTEDIFLSQNFFGTQPELPRLDTGRALLLRNAGKGQLVAMPGQESGITIYGEQRGAALSDFNQDGRVDLAVTQNNGMTKLYVNSTAKRGLRVRLAGPPGNSLGIGATLRLQFGERLGPIREVHAGSGYWSQDSAVQVLGFAEPATKLHVRWPGGREQTLPVPAEATLVDVQFPQ